MAQILIHKLICGKCFGVIGRVGVIGRLWEALGGRSHREALGGFGGKESSGGFGTGVNGRLLPPTCGKA